MYDETQDQLKAAGVDSVTLHRGMYLDDIGGGAVVHQSDVTGIKLAELQLQPINSFSTSLDEAGKFGDLIFTAEVPAERIIAFTRSGLGCLNEWEFVVADGPGSYIFTGRGIRFSELEGIEFGAGA